MNKKILSTLTVMVGVLALMGAGCSLKSLVNNKKPEVTNPSAACEAGKEIAAPNAQVKELKTILNEAGCDVILTEDTKLDSPIQGTLVFVWKNEPKPDKLERAFKNHGYKVEMSDAFITAQKADIILKISLADDKACKKISVNISEKSQKTNSNVTDAECAKLMAVTLIANYYLTVNDLEASYVWSGKVFEVWDGYAKKYSTTREEIDKECRTRVKNPGFDEKVDQEKKGMGVNI